MANLRWGSIDEYNWDSKLYSSPAHHTSFVRKLLCKKRAVQRLRPNNLGWGVWGGGVKKVLVEGSMLLWVSVTTNFPTLLPGVCCSTNSLAVQEDNILCSTLHCLVHISSEVQRITIIVWHKICNFGLQRSSMKEVLLQCDEVDLCCSRRLVEVHKS